MLGCINSSLLNNFDTQRILDLITIRTWDLVLWWHDINIIILDFNTDITTHISHLYFYIITLYSKLTCNVFKFWIIMQKKITYRKLFATFLHLGFFSYVFVLGILNLITIMNTMLYMIDLCILNDNNISYTTLHGYSALTYLKWENNLLSLVFFFFVITFCTVMFFINKNLKIFTYIINNMFDLILTSKAYALVKIQYGILVLQKIKLNYIIFSFKLTHTNRYYFNFFTLWIWLQGTFTTNLAYFKNIQNKYHNNLYVVCLSKHLNGDVVLNMNFNFIIFFLNFFSFLLKDHLQLNISAILFLEKYLYHTTYNVNNNSTITDYIHTKLTYIL